ncbi:CaiB/BaiF CoA-transferase family protein [Paraburkholderia sp.]|uniref:CaiB/BaiF CoA transferase family protein n=1 Tax=Paraburkholderia sp. TaxID=1926495 RepID=UPI002390E99C|nr:CaiB/BaiF CoA-transferase family protein [Paraburkholderia sp.]MDE1184041.1 CaiB/BaiF CoA-transferase family protein [Paraburkholderia sp.]
MSTVQTSLPLQGLRVLDLTRLLPGPVAALRLAELGAEVLKIEAPGAGDPTRTMMQSSADRVAGRPGAFYRIVNRGKRETRLDLKSEAGRTVLRALAREADVLIESFRPGVMTRLGCDYETLREANPKLVYCAITGYGTEGPYAQQAGHDLNYIAYAGVLDQLSSRDGAPILPNFQIADLLGGALAAVTQILAALWQVARGGEGRFVDVSMAHVTHAHNLVAQIGVLNDGNAPPAGSGLLNGGVPCYNLYETLDGRWLALGALEHKFWETLCMALDRPEWAVRHWSLGQAIGGPDAKALTLELTELFGNQTLDDWLALLEPLDCCVSPVLTAAEAAAHPLFNPRQDHADPDSDESDDANHANDMHGLNPQHAASPAGPFVHGGYVPYGVNPYAGQQPVAPPAHEMQQTETLSDATGGAMGEVASEGAIDGSPESAVEGAGNANPSGPGVQPAAPAQNSDAAPAAPPINPNRPRTPYDT